MRRRRAVQNLPADSSDEDEPLSKIANGTAKRARPSNGDDSSSESDIENYLQRPDKIDLNSPFFNLQKDVPEAFEKVENAILSGVATLTDSDESSDEKTAVQNVPSTSKLNFTQLHEYAKKLADAKRHVDEYNAKRRAKEKETNIENLLAAGESKQNDANVVEEANYRSSEFESCSDSEKEGWEEVEEKKKEESLVPKGDLQITVEMPNAVKKKKGVDLLAAIKRRVNRVRKENQVLVHKVHLLCWIAHGNYVSSVINSQNVLGAALSLLPSKQSYPDGRTDLNYLTAILKWYQKAVVNVEKNAPNSSLNELLEAQIEKKEAYNKKMLVYIFVAIMRALGIHCRLVLSFVVEPLRPPNSELHSLSTKTETKSGSSKPSTKNEVSAPTKPKVEVEKPKPRSKSTSANIDKKKVELSAADGKRSARSKSTNEAPPKSKAEPSKNKASTRSTEKSKIKTDEEKVEQNVRSKSATVVSQNKPKRSSKVKAVVTPKKMSTPTRKIESVDKTVKSRTKTTSEVSEGANKPKRNSKTSKTEQNGTPEVERKAKKESTRTLRSQKQPARSVPQLDGANDSPKPRKPNLRKLTQEKSVTPNKNNPKRSKAPIKYRDTDSEDEFTSTRSPFTSKNTDPPQTSQRPNLKKLKDHVPKPTDVRSDIIDIVKERIKKQKELERSRTAPKRKNVQNDDEDDSDYAPEEIKKKHRESEDEFVPKVKVKRRIQVKNNDLDDENSKKKQGVDVWVEVFLEAEEKWISVDVVKGEIHCVSGLYNRATHPVSYVVAWNNDNRLKDVTQRYCTNFNTVTRKLRTDAKWWSATLKPFLGTKTVRDKEEDDEFARQHLEKPLPTSVAEYKNHPLYVLKRHLLKFEALYPPDAPTLGFVRNEPVYSRQCVYTLHSREIWFKYAKVVKPGEQPYKIVKARPKWDKLSNAMITGQMLEIFGEWQTEDYDPPAAENGIVPRNAFGNVELFKPCMLPKKTVHLQLAGLNKVAKRMNIDCAPAVVGFDFHGGWNHPVYDGFIVCEEYEDVLIAAWDLEQEELDRKEQEKIDKRVYGNWRRLIRGLLIRERLKAKYEFGPTPGETGAKKKTKTSKKRQI